MTPLTSLVRVGFATATATCVAACAAIAPQAAPTPTAAQSQTYHAMLATTPLKPGNGHDTMDADAARYENLRGTEFTRSARIARAGAVEELRHAPRADIGRTVVDTRLGAMTVDRFVGTFPLDGVVIVHRGRIVYERYPRMRANDAHQIYSVSKVIPALLVGELVEQGRVDPQQPIERYLPALSGTAWRGVLVQNILDMASGMDETGLADESWEATFWRSQFVATAPSPYALIAGMRRSTAVPQGTDFEYATRNTFVLAWLLEEVWQQPFSRIVSERLWQRIGAEHDAFMGISPHGAPHTEFMMTVRDLARVGLLYLRSPALLERIQRDGRPQLLQGIERELNERGFDHEPVHHNGWQWDAVFADGTLFKAGYGGQGLLVAPREQVVVAFVGSWPAMDRQEYSRFQWIARQLIRRGVFR